MKNIILKFRYGKNKAKWMFSLFSHGVTKGTEKGADGVRRRQSRTGAWGEGDLPLLDKAGRL